MSKKKPVMLPEQTWKVIRAEYKTGQGSLKDLALLHEIPASTVEKRSAREGWRKEVAEMGKKVAAIATETAIEEGKKLGMEAADLERRTLNETAKFLDRITERLDEGDLTIHELRALVSGWKDVVGVGRQTLRMDDDSAKVNVGLLLSLPSVGGSTCYAATGEQKPVLAVGILEEPEDA